MRERYRKSLEYLERAKKVTPGAAQTLSKMPARFPQGAFPVAYSYAKGACIVDVDGNEFVDWICGLGAVTLGYALIDICDMVRDSLYGGLSSGSLPHESEEYIAFRFCQKIPCAEMVRFVNSGSEATEAAIRTARIATGRDIILTVRDGYHSWHSWFQAVKSWHPGVPHEYEHLIRGFEYNHLQSVDRLFDVWSKRIAAVIMEPCLFESPSEGFLQGVRELCTKNKSLLIFDEMVTGYRWALAGGQEYFGVMPDLATFGKGMANGLPIGMLCGKRDYMQHAELVSGTFGGNPVSLAAANAVLDVYESEDVIGKMWSCGTELQLHFNNLAYNLGANGYATCDGYACKPRFVFSCENKDNAMSLFLQVTAEHGMLAHPGGLNVCYALTDKDMAVSKNAVTQGLQAVHRAVTTDDWSRLTGDIIQPVVTVRS